MSRTKVKTETWTIYLREFGDLFYLKAKGRGFTKKYSEAYRTKDLVVAQKRYRAVCQTRYGMKLGLYGSISGFGRITDGT